MIPVSIPANRRRSVEVDWSKEPDSDVKPVHLLSDKSLADFAERNAKSAKMVKFTNLAILSAVAAGWIAFPPPTELQKQQVADALSTPPLTAHRVIEWEPSSDPAVRALYFGADGRWAFGQRVDFALLRGSQALRAAPGAFKERERFAMAKSDAQGEAELLVRPQTAQTAFVPGIHNKYRHQDAQAAGGVAPAPARWIVAERSQPVDLRENADGSWDVSAKGTAKDPVTLWAYAYDEEKAPDGRSRFVGVVGATRVSDSHAQLAAIDEGDRSDAMFAITLLGGFFWGLANLIRLGCDPKRFEREIERREKDAWRGRVHAKTAPRGPRGPGMR
jgi:hypothetical protein